MARKRYVNEKIDARNSAMDAKAKEVEPNWIKSSYNASHGMGKNIEKTGMDVQGHAQNQSAAATNEWNEWFKRDPDAASKAWMEYQNANNFESNPSDGVARYRNVPTKGKPYYVTNPSHLNMDSGLGDLVMQNRVMYKPDGTFDVDHSKNLQNAFEQKIAAENQNNFQRLGERDYIGKGSYRKSKGYSVADTTYNNGVQNVSVDGERLFTTSPSGRQMHPLDADYFGNYAGKGYVGKNSMNYVFTPTKSDFSVNGFKGYGIDFYGDSFFNSMDNQYNINPKMNNIGISSSLNDPYAKETNAYLKEHGNVFSPSEESPVSNGGQFVGPKEEPPVGKPSIAQGKNVGYSGMSEEFDPSRTIEGAPKERLTNTKDTASNIARIDSENAQMNSDVVKEINRLMKTDPNRAKALANELGINIEYPSYGAKQGRGKVQPIQTRSQGKLTGQGNPRWGMSGEETAINDVLDNWRGINKGASDTSFFDNKYPKGIGGVKTDALIKGASNAGGYADESASVKNVPPQKANAMRTLDDLIQNGTLKPSTNDARTANVNGAKKVPPQDTSNGPKIYPKVDGPYTNTSSKIAGMGRLANSGANKLVQAFPTASSFAVGTAIEPMLEGIEREVVKPISDAIYNNMPEELQRRLSGVPEQYDQIIAYLLPSDQREIFLEHRRMQRAFNNDKLLSKEQAYKKYLDQLYYDVQDPNYIG